NDRGEPHDRQLFDRKQRGESLARHRPPTDALEGDGIAEPLEQHLHQPGPQPVTGFFRRNQEDSSCDMVDRAARHHTGRPATKMPAASAASMVACGSAKTVLPAMMAIPASLAFAAPSTVRAPMVGRS